MSVITGPCLNRIKPATSTDKVFKEECVYSFDNPESENGLYVCLNTFFGIGKQHLDRFSRIYQSHLFLNIKRTRHKLKSPETMPAEKLNPTKLAIGVPGGFAVEHDIFDINEEYQIVFLNKGHMHIYSLVDTNVPSIVVECAKSVIQSESSLLKMLMPDNSNIGWSGEIRQISKYSKDLKQINSGLKIPPSGWQCEKCDLKSNLWLNLTDGSIMCGRRFFDGTGGNNHAVEHYELTGFPLSVKLEL
ncbi:hypothetical protein GJ496_008845 [Pomphorhynchus laevis]|nr:hypothetical protein GJ496_008845 [Pomphorhynchus laevis]